MAAPRGALVLIIKPGDRNMRKFADRLKALGDRDARRVMSMALNTEGNKGRTQVRKALRAQSGIQSHEIRKVMKTYKASASKLTYELNALGHFTNISQFHMRVKWTRLTTGAWAGAKAQIVSAAPWNQRREFPGTFSVGQWGKKVYKRTQKGRGPVEPVYGPNIARELRKAQSKEAWLAVPAKVGVEVGRLLGLLLAGKIKLGGRGY